jgi:prevent-host-death family protein
MATSTLLTMTAKELKNRTGEALRAVEQGRRVLLTRRGRPVAVLMPVAGGPSAEPDDLPYEQAWREIEAALRATKPRDRSWRRAMDRTRRRG